MKTKKQLEREIKNEMGKLICLSKQYHQNKKKLDKLR